MSRTADGIRVIHVDDDPDFAEVTATFLEREDDRFSVATATSAEEAIEAAVRPKLVRHSVGLTAFGEEFCEVCLPYAGEGPTVEDGAGEDDEGA